MSPVARLVDVPANALELARRLSDRPGVALLGGGFGGGAAFVACDPIATSTALDPEPELPLGSLSGPLGAVPRWMGALPYEACRDLERAAWTRQPEERPAPFLTAPRWQRYDAVARVTDRVLVVGDDLRAVERLGRLLRRSAPPQALTVKLVGEEPSSRHAARVAQALELIAAGDLYQVNLARCFEFHLEGHVVAAFSEIVKAGAAPYSAALDLGDAALVSSSPERFLTLRADGVVLTSPIKGTRPRGADARADAALAAALDDDPKERAELAMVIDVERNDLGRVARTGSVRLVGAPRVSTLPTVHHREATVAARLRVGVSREGLLAALLPSGSVTGAPKVRAMEVIACLEAERRGLYTGAFGALFHDGGLELGMAIRTLEVRGRAARYFVGGGIVADSEPHREVEETYWKARQLAALLGGHLGGDLQKLVRKGADL